MPPIEHGHSHVFLGAAHEASERRTWAVIWLCGAMMAAEIVGGLMFGSIALVADGLHMSTHAGALLLAALAYTYSRRHADDRRFTFGTGKLGDLAGFTSAIVLAMISLLIAYEAVMRFAHPVAIHFGQAIPIAAIGLCVNLASAWLLGGGHHHHEHGHEHEHDDEHHDHGHHHHAAHGRDNNLRAAVIHVAADAAVSVLVIAGLLLARRVRVAVDGSARGAHRRGGDRQLVLRAGQGHRSHPARHEPGRAPGREATPDGGSLWRRGGGPSPVALGAGPSWRDRLRRHRVVAGAGLLSRAAGALPSLSHLTIETVRR
ncbi:MAG: CDF family Co(II)/Ni(II) efflux transporter DmeF [Caulobacteraceae bacterium]